MQLFEKRIYEAYSSKDGFRVLADRLWARGITKAEAHYDLWAKEITPSNELRKWFHENLDMFNDFEAKYLNELRTNPDLENFLNDIRDHDVVTLLSSVKDLERSHISVLKGFIEKELE